MTNVACTVTFFAKLVDVGVAEGRAMHKASFSQDFVSWKISDIFPKIVSMWTKNKWLSTMRFDQNWPKNSDVFFGRTLSLFLIFIERKLTKGAFTYDVRCFGGIFDLPTYPNQILYYISLCSKIRCSLTYLHTQESDVICECALWPILDP